MATMCSSSWALASASLPVRRAAPNQSLTRCVTCWLP
ncbi:unnamed protein product [Chondrus crispus]|uniref:Uncharacterized protein n=1 Tax=Chondrus crispus TaxID=2769 RepID=R7QC07_CHOCR|nr:unnamed protein product [Chondrus crispus]CDF34975.1 unnamed protein product [Chondrus crispus]|eukprot:XP_005714794.1 unnamed protein product [Chondrus crispus]